MKTIRTFLYSASCALVFASHAALATRLMPSDLTYIGAFMVPNTAIYAGMGSGDEPSSLSYRPDGNPTNIGGGLPGSLFLSNGGDVAEINIPQPVKSSDFSSLNVATQLQAAHDIFTGVDIGQDDRFGAVAYVPPEGGWQTSPMLYFSLFIYYNAAGDDYNSIGAASIDLSQPNPMGLWHVGPPANGNMDSPYEGNKYGDYIIPISQTWANEYTGGRSLLVGRYKEAGADGGSMGPVLTAIAPWQDSSLKPGSDLSAMPLMYFNSVTDHTGDETWMDWRINGDPDYSYYSAGDYWRGGAWVQAGDKLALLLVGRHGTYGGTSPCPQTALGDGCHGAVGTDTPPYCYGIGGIDCPWGIAVTDNKGYHTGPYVPRIIFIDPTDLAAAAQGKESPQSVQAYAEYDPTNDWPWHDCGPTSSGGFNAIGGVAYDAAHGYLYLVQASVYRPGGCPNTPWPVIQVYKVNGASSTPNALPNAPNNVVVK